MNAATAVLFAVVMLVFCVALTATAPSAVPCALLAAVAAPSAVPCAELAALAAELAAENAAFA